MTTPTLDHRTVRLRYPVPPLWRAPGVLQIGIDPGRSVVLDGVPESLADAVRVLDQPQTRVGLGQLLPRVAPEWIDWLLDRLDSGGLLDCESGARRPPSTSAEVIGSGPLAAAVRASLVEVSGRLAPTVPAATAPEVSPCVTVVAGDTAEPDRAPIDDLFRSGRTHLLVRLEPGNAVVGPLVIPGRTPCVHCGDLRRAHLDRAWPALLAQLNRERPHPQPTLLAWAASTAALQVRALAAGSGAETIGRTMEMAAGEWILRARTWPAHPGCGCLVPIA